MDQTTLSLLIALVGLCYFDIKYRLVFNAITIPMALIGCLITGNWLWALLMFAVMGYFYWLKIFAGGDVKLMTMIAAFIGSEAVTVLLISFIFLCAYRYFKRGAVPYTPFVLASYILAIFGQFISGMVLI